MLGIVVWVINAILHIRISGSPPRADAGLVRQHAHWQTSAETQHARYGGYNDVGAV